MKKYLLEKINPLKWILVISRDVSFLQLFCKVNIVNETHESKLFKHDLVKHKSIDRDIIICKNQSSNLEFSFILKSKILTTTL
jgi:hypothetical protein